MDKESTSGILSRLLKKFGAFDTGTDFFVRDMVKDARKPASSSSPSTGIFAVGWNSGAPRPTQRASSRTRIDTSPFAKRRAWSSLKWFWCYRLPADKPKTNSNRSICTKNRGRCILSSALTSCCPRRWMPNPASSLDAPRRPLTVGPRPLNSTLWRRCAAGSVSYSRTASTEEPRWWLNSKRKSCSKHAAKAEVAGWHA